MNTEMNEFYEIQLEILETLEKTTNKLLKLQEQQKEFLLNILFKKNEDF